MEVAQQSSEESDSTDALSSVGAVIDDGWQVSNYSLQVTGEQAAQVNTEVGTGPDCALAVRSEGETTTNNPEKPGNMTKVLCFFNKNQENKKTTVK